MKNNKTFNRLTPDHPPKKPFSAFMKAEVGLLITASVVGLLAYIINQGNG